MNSLTSQSQRHSSHSQCNVHRKPLLLQPSFHISGNEDPSREAHLPCDGHECMMNVNILVLGEAHAVVMIGFGWRKEKRKVRPKVEKDGNVTPLLIGKLMEIMQKVYCGILIFLKWVKIKLFNKIEVFFYYVFSPLFAEIIPKKASTESFCDINLRIEIDLINRCVCQQSRKATCPLLAMQR